MRPWAPTSNETVERLYREADKINSLALRAWLTFDRTWQGRLAFGIWIVAAFRLAQTRRHTTERTLEMLIAERS